MVLGTQQMPQGTLRQPATHLWPSDLCVDDAGCLGVIRVEPVEFIRLDHIKLWPLEGELCTGTVVPIELARRWSSTYKQGLSLSLCISAPPLAHLEFSKSFLKRQ